MTQQTTFISPCAMRETAQGIQFTRICDEMFARRELACTGPVNEAMAADFVQQIRQLEHEDPDAAITVFVASPGGSVSSGLAIYDALRLTSCPVRTVCLDTAASMGSIIFLAGDKREMSSHAEIMIHDPLIGQGAGGSALAVQEQSRRLMEVRRALTQIMVERAGLSSKRIHAMTAKDTYLSAERACELGFAHSVIASRKDIAHA